LTHATTLRDAFHEAKIHIDPSDTVEPGLDQPLVTNNYEVNIYRARPVVVVDGSVRKKIMSSYQTASQIAQQAGVKLQKEDKTKLTANTNMVSQGAGIELSIDRATSLTLVLYGAEANVYTHATTVAELLKEKEITLAENDATSVPLDTRVTGGMKVELWRDGVQTVAVEETIDFGVREVLDADRPVGFRAVQTPGEEGKKKVIYEVEALDGREISRTEIQSVVVADPKEQIEIVGTKPSAGALTKSKGAQHFTDSLGVVHRETYYDLPMNVVIRACGGGAYSVRSADGAKVDQDGYILVAANYNRYPRCSVVETSMGLGKVYDTGGFALVHPDGFDLATDWTNNNGT
jgi:uncharacterized protein YabE (DUF348 family)